MCNVHLTFLSLRHGGGPVAHRVRVGTPGSRCPRLDGRHRLRGDARRRRSLPDQRQRFRLAAFGRIGTLYRPPTNRQLGPRATTHRQSHHRHRARRPHRGARGRHHRRTAPRTFPAPQLFRPLLPALPRNPGARFRFHHRPERDGPHQSPCCRRSDRDPRHPTRRARLQRPTGRIGPRHRYRGSRPAGSRRPPRRASRHGVRPDDRASGRSRSATPSADCSRTPSPR